MKRLSSSLDLLPVEQFVRLMSETTRYERFGAILLDATGTQLGGAWLSQDCQDGTTFRLRDLARVALHHDAVAMILVHTHPHSAKPTPSKLDLETTRTVHEYFSRIGVSVLDHHIYGAGGQHVFSFAQARIVWSNDPVATPFALRAET